MFTILKFKKTPKFVASRKKIGNGLVEEEWYTEEVALPSWWNQECHALIETQTIGGVGYQKYCKLCNREIPENGCIHNITNK